MAFYAPNIEFWAKIGQTPPPGPKKNFARFVFQVSANLIARVSTNFLSFFRKVGAYMAFYEPYIDFRAKIGQTPSPPRTKKIFAHFVLQFPANLILQLVTNFLSSF